MKEEKDPRMAGRSLMRGRFGHPLAVVWGKRFEHVSGPVPHVKGRNGSNMHSIGFLWEVNYLVHGSVWHIVDVQYMLSVLIITISTGAGARECGEAVERGG